MSNNLKLLFLKPLLVSAETAAGLLSVSRSMFYQLLSSQRIPLKAVKFGAKRLYRVKDIEAFVEADCSKEWKASN